jgi:hypothetical protein
VARSSQETYRLELLNLSPAEAKGKLWADGWLVATRRPDSRGESLIYQDKAGSSFNQRDRAGWLLAALLTDGDRLVDVAFYDTNTTTGEAVPMPPHRIFAR